MKVVLPENYKKAIVEAQKYWRSRIDAGETVTCPFVYISALRVGDFPWSGCKICHAWMGTEQRRFDHPCNALNYDQKIKRFWREVL